MRRNSIERVAGSGDCILGKGKIEGRELKGVRMTEDRVGKKSLFFVFTKVGVRSWCVLLVDTLRFANHEIVFKE